jgi:hypothetical protein
VVNRLPVNMSRPMHVLPGPIELIKIPTRPTKMPDPIELIKIPTRPTRPGPSELIEIPTRHTLPGPIELIEIPTRHTLPGPIELIERPTVRATIDLGLYMSQMSLSAGTQVCDLSLLLMALFANIVSEMDAIVHPDLLCASCVCIAACSFTGLVCNGTTDTEELDAINARLCRECRDRPDCAVCHLCRYTDNPENDPHNYHNGHVPSAPGMFCPHKMCDDCVSNLLSHSAHMVAYHTNTLSVQLSALCQKCVHCVLSEGSAVAFKYHTKPLLCVDDNFSIGTKGFVRDRLIRAYTQLYTIFVGNGNDGRTIAEILGDISDIVRLTGDGKGVLTNERFNLTLTPTQVASIRDNDLLSPGFLQWEDENEPWVVLLLQKHGVLSSFNDTKYPSVLYALWLNAINRDDRLFSDWGDDCHRLESECGPQDKDEVIDLAHRMLQGIHSFYQKYLSYSQEFDDDQTIDDLENVPRVSEHMLTMLWVVVTKMYDLRSAMNDPRCDVSNLAHAVYDAICELPFFGGVELNGNTHELYLKWMWEISHRIKWMLSYYTDGVWWVYRQHQDLSKVRDRITEYDRTFNNALSKPTPPNLQAVAKVVKSSGTSNALFMAEFTAGMSHDKKRSCDQLSDLANDRPWKR